MGVLQPYRDRHAGLLQVLTLVVMGARLHLLNNGHTGCFNQRIIGMVKQILLGGMWCRQRASKLGKPRQGRAQDRPSHISPVFWAQQTPKFPTEFTFLERRAADK